MAYSINEFEDNFFEVVYSGVVDLHQRKNAVDKVCQIIQKKGYSGGLIDVRNMIMNMSKDEQVEFARFLADKNELRNLKIAILHEQARNPNLIVDAVAYHSGHPTVPFYCEKEARLWLLGLLK